VGSIPDEIIGFFSWPNPFSHTVALGSTLPLREISARNLPGGKGQPVHEADNLSTICELIVWQIWEPWRHTTLWAFTAYYRDSVTIFFYKLHSYLFLVCKLRNEFNPPKSVIQWNPHLMCLPQHQGFPSFIFQFQWSQVNNLIKFLWFKIFPAGFQRNLSWGSTASILKPYKHIECSVLQTDEQEVITFLLTTEIIPLCLRIMESGSELSKTVATFILQKILLDDSGLSYICQTYDRFSHVAMILVSNAWWEIVMTLSWTVVLILHRTQLILELWCRFL
jgi:hypothetical protein